MSLMDKVEGEPLRFQLNDKTPGSDVRMIIQANSEENKDTWIRQIRSILDMQGNFLRGLYHLVYIHSHTRKKIYIVVLIITNNKTVAFITRSLSISHGVIVQKAALTGDNYDGSLKWLSSYPMTYTIKLNNVVRTQE